MSSSSVVVVKHRPEDEAYVKSLWNGDGECIVALVDGLVRGMLVFNNTGLISTVVVDQGVRRQGVGTALVRYAVRMLREQTDIRVLLKSRTTTTTVCFFIANGFRESKEGEYSYLQGKSFRSSVARHLEERIQQLQGTHKKVKNAFGDCICIGHKFVHDEDTTVVVCTEEISQRGDFALWLRDASDCFVWLRRSIFPSAPAFMNGCHFGGAGVVVVVHTPSCIYTVGVKSSHHKLMQNPVGAVDQGEEKDWRVAARRELKEEVGLEVLNLDHLKPFISYEHESVFMGAIMPSFNMLYFLELHLTEEQASAISSFCTEEITRVILFQESDLRDRFDQLYDHHRIAMLCAIQRAKGIEDDGSWKKVNTRRNFRVF